ncbi:MAG: hypothetical protein LUC91_05020 [Prevotella sp.]|nr:hypothetical protein [Prevotella sp.]
MAEEVHIHKPFKLMCMKEWIPFKIRPWIFVCIILVYQTSNVVYLSSSENMYGELSLLHEDVMMCLYAAFAGMNIAFPMMWRFKFRFTTRTILTITATTMIICNFITAHTGSMPVLLGACLIAGFAKMWGTFECISSINPWLAPNLDFPRFFPLLYMFILAPISLSALIDTNLTYFFTWREMHWFIMGAFLVVLLFARICMVDFFPMGQGKLLAFDFVGLLLWSLLMMQMSFIAIYGEHYDWLHSSEMRLAVGSCLITAGLCFGRMFHIRHPYIKWDALCYRRVPVALLLFFLTDLISETPNSLQNIFTGSLLGFDTMNTVNFNWFSILGMLGGCLFSLGWLWKWRLPVIRLCFFGIACAIGYQLFMYFLTSESASLEDFYFPTFLRTFGYAAVYCSLTYYLKQFIPFDHFLQVLAIVGVIRSGIGGSVGEAVYGYGLRWAISKNSADLGYTLDNVNTVIQNMSYESVYGSLMKQVMAVSIKELWGWTAIVCIFLFLFMLFFDSPTMATIRKWPKRIYRRVTVKSN